MKAFRILAVAALVSLGLNATASAFPVLAEWTFETSLPAGTDSATNGPHSAEGGLNAGAGSPARGVHADALTDWSNPAGNGTPDSFSSTNWTTAGTPGDYYQFSTSTTGYTAINITFDHVSSSTGPRDFAISVSPDCTTYSAVSTYSVRANAAPPWSSGSTNLPDRYSVNLPVSVDNQAGMCVRLTQNSLVSANGGSVASTGTSRVDTVQISGDLIPEPATLSLLVLGGLALIRRRR